MQKFLNRYEAGKLLAKQLQTFKKQENTVVLALPRGGVPVGWEVAKSLSLPLDVLVVKKIGVPGYEELALGAITLGGVTVFNEEVVRNFHITKSTLEELIEEKKRVLQEAERFYRGSHLFPSLKDKTVILIDDGIATGATIKAGIKALRQQQAKEIIVAIPVAAQESLIEMKSLADDVVCLLEPYEFYAVGNWYEDFSQTSDDEVRELLQNSKEHL